VRRLESKAAAPSSDLPNSGYRFMRVRHGWSSSGALQRNDARLPQIGVQKPSTFWASRTTAVRRGAESSWSNERHNKTSDAQTQGASGRDETPPLARVALAGDNSLGRLQGRHQRAQRSPNRIPRSAALSTLGLKSTDELRDAANYRGANVLNFWTAACA
jgi:hypothetical protein